MSIVLNNQNKIKNIVFDLGGVLIDWNPRYLYRKVFSQESEMEHFLTHICHQEWNERHDAGQPFAVGIQELTKQHPQYKREIEMYFERWAEMLGSEITSTAVILKKLHQSKNFKLLALSNWSAETFHHALERYDFLKLFEHIVVSGRIGIKKPDSQIFEHLCQISQIKPQETLFIDDVEKNIVAAQKLNFLGHHYQSHEKLNRFLQSLKIL